MREILLDLSALLLIYAPIVVIAATIRAALKARKQYPAKGEPPPQPTAMNGGRREEPYYQPICHHSHPLHLAK